jgi:hypothetical protein
MAKTGPTPDPNAPAATVARRIAAPELQEVAVALLPAAAGWRPATLEAYLTYAESNAARVLRHEDVAEVHLLFALVDQRLRYTQQLTGSAVEDLQTLQAMRIADGMIDRKAANLGIGPLARTRLGIARVEQAAKLNATAARSPSSDY